jgi:catechol 2,3-dioxygenase-like lactoylglutathione lyase family enzyme
LPSGVPMTTTETTIGINGMAHVILTVSQFAAARAFYGRLLPALGMTPVCDTDKLFYCVGARTAIGIQPAGPAHNGDRFLQSRVGLHHLCLRARSREDVDRLHDLLRQMGAIIIHGPQKPPCFKHARLPIDMPPFRFSLCACGSRAVEVPVWSQTSNGPKINTCKFYKFGGWSCCDNLARARCGRRAPSHAAHGKTCKTSPS